MPTLATLVEITPLGVWDPDELLVEVFGANYRAIHDPLSLCKAVRKFGLVRDNQLVGYCMVHNESGTLTGMWATVMFFGITASMRLRGLGRRMFHLAMDAAGVPKGTRVGLNSLPSAVKFWQKMGFSLEGKQVVVGGREHQLMTMVWR